MQFSIYPPRFKKSRKHATRSLAIQQLEDRSVPATFAVTNLQSGGVGSLRQAILSANANAGADLISFDVQGTIRVTNAALPAITEQVDIDGTTAPGFAGTPSVAIDFNRFNGLRFNAGSAESALRSLSLGRSAGNGVTVNNAGGMLFVGNYIGIGLDGTTAVGNVGDGIELNNSSGSTIGGTSALDRNVISANRNNGIRLTGSSNNQILGNYIGTNAGGTLDRGNVSNGIRVTGGTGNTIGGTLGNVISGNDFNGVMIGGRAKFTTVSGNLIGVTASGNTALGNKLDGVRIQNASNNLIGHSDPVTGVSYANTDNVNTQPVSGWQGIRNSDTPGQYLISGTSGSSGLLFDGTMAGVGASYLVNYPGAADTSVYGPDNLDNSTIRLVGSYRNPDFATAAVEVNGFLFEGTTADLTQAANYQTIDYPGAKFNYVHSTMGGLAVGNYDSPIDHGTFNLPIGPGHAFIYDIAQQTFITDVVYPGSLSNTAYGIWYNGDSSYTICGGYSLDAAENFGDQSKPIGQAYIVDYNSVTGEFSKWTTFVYPNGTDYITHFEGISSVEKGVYTLNADSLQSGTNDPAQGSWVSVRRNSDGSFGNATWVDLNYPGVDPTTNVTSSNSVYGNQVVGIVIGASPFSYQATVNVGFQLSNVISGNGRNGIGLVGANDNKIAMNYIGTDSSGTIDIGNSRNGIVVADGAKGNLIGGEATGGNDPTNGVFARPPQGNLISGNDMNGVLLTSGATQNQLSGNFIGTASSGNSALGNRLDGVAIVNASGNSLIGCTLREDPFVFYNVLSGNGQNGLRVSSSNNTTIQANFFGMGANNDTAVGNMLNGVVVEGTSANTVMGGPIPLGNVVAANLANGLVVRGTASDFVTYNTFCGLAAFSENMNFGNGLDGMLITSTGKNILLRTNVITRNGDDGIEISGAAHGVRVAGNIIGLNTNGNAAMGNLGNGVEIGGNAYDIIIGGPQPTFNIIPHNAISANGDNGVAIVGRAHDVHVDFSFIGTNLAGTAAIGNAHAGVYVGPGTRSSTIGSTDLSRFTVISGNLGDGINMLGTSGNKVIGSLIGTDSTGLFPLPNGGNGVRISDSSNNVVGRTTMGSDGPANRIAFNGANGVFIEGGSRNGIRENSIFGNGLLGIDVGQIANASTASPELTSVHREPLGMMISGTATGNANTTMTVEFFASDTNSPSGRYYLGSQTVKTNAAGTADFTFSGPHSPLGANFMTATLTDASGRTSEFSAVEV